MRKMISKTAKLLLALMIPAMFLFSCNEDVVEPTNNVIPPKNKIVPR